jgi:hypothetical protein
MATSALEFIAAYSEALGINTPTEEEVNQILALAGVAAHASERTAAPVACWLAARAGRDLSEARQVAEMLANDIGDGASE